MTSLHEKPLSPTETAARTGGGGGSLPPELLQRVVSRVRVLCLVLGSVGLIYALIVLLIQLGVLHPRPRVIDDVAGFARRFYPIAGASFALAATVFAASRARGLTAARIFRLGAALQVLGALCITSAEHLVPMPAAIFGVSHVCVWILSFNFIPATPRRAALGAFAAATMGPAGLALNAAWNHGVWPAPDALLLLFLPNYIAATLSVMTTAMVHRLGRDVARARRLGSYRLVERLGQGGMGEVWRAEHRSLIRPAAVKLMRGDLAAGLTIADGQALLRRFRREVQATALLQSPHTVAVYDFGRHEDGTLYYVMELLRGIDLQEVVKRAGPQPAERVIHILKQVCHSLADAHRFGLVHRDIKPGNIMLCVLGLELDFVKVLDFGLVRDQRGGFEAGLTVQGAVQGTPAYLAPEAAVGGEADARADLYSLGCVAYWLLTGTMVFRGHNPMAMLAAHVRTPAEPPSRRTELPIPPALEQLVLDLLAKDPDDRPQSAAEVARRLDRIAPATPWTRDRAERWWQVHSPRVLHADGGLEAAPSLPRVA